MDFLDFIFEPSYIYDRTHPLGYDNEFVSRMDDDDLALDAEWALRNDRAVVLLAAKGVDADTLDMTLEDMEFMVVELYTRTVH